jgi:hypothetical protein
MQRALGLGLGVAALASTMSAGCGGIVAVSRDGELGKLDGSIRVLDGSPSNLDGDGSGADDLAADTPAPDAAHSLETFSDGSEVDSAADAADVAVDAAFDVEPDAEGVITWCNGAWCRGTCDRVPRADGTLSAPQCVCRQLVGGCVAPTVCCNDGPFCTAHCSFGQ